MSAFRFSALLACLVALPLHAHAQGAGVAPDGRKGQLHVVVPGDTLWDITARYLGTPWIWPSIWRENAGIENPHRIYPGDRIWITERSMRKVEPEEAAQLVKAAAEAGPAGPPAAEGPAAGGSEPVAEPDPFGVLDQGEAVEARELDYPGLDRVSWITPDQDAGAGAVLGSHEEHYWVAQAQRTIISLGEGQVNVGDTFHVYRVRRRVLHPVTRKIVGYLTQNLGIAEVTEIHPEASFAKIIASYAEIEPGDRVTPYVEPPTRVRERPVEHHVSGMVVAQQPYRLYSGWNDFVILDRGSSHGVQPGNRFRLFRSGKEVRDPITSTRVMVPDDVIGAVFVVSVTPTTSLALITRADRKIREGDRFRDI